MRATRIAWGILTLAILATAGFLAWQHLAITKLRIEVEGLRRDQSELVQLRSENARLSARQASDADRAALRRAEMIEARLRRRISAAADPASPPPRAGSKSGDLLPASAWKFAGRATPRDTLESVLWAATHGDVDQLATLIRFNAGVRERAETFFAQLPESDRTQYGSPEKVFATLLAGDMPTDIGAMGVLIGPPASASGDSANVLMRLQRESGLNKDVYFQLQKDPDGWQLVIPAGIESAYEEQIAGEPLPPTSASDQARLAPAQPGRP